jgi:hypothetical protein
MADVAAIADLRGVMGIGGHFNHSGNDGTISKFGWKAQNIHGGFLGRSI